MELMLLTSLLTPAFNILVPSSAAPYWLAEPESIVIGVIVPLSFAPPNTGVATVIGI